MDVDVRVFGAFRDVQPDGIVRVPVEGNDVAALRRAIERYAADAWPASAQALIARSALASEARIMRDGEALPANGPMALLPPVSGG